MLDLVEIWEQEVKDMEGCGEAYLRALEFLEIVKAKQGEGGMGDV